MSELNNRLNRLAERVEELEKNPSELTKDNLLAEVRAFYDVVKATELQTAQLPIVEEVAVPEPVAETPAEPVAEVEPEPEPEVVPEPIAEVKEELVVEETVEPTPEPALVAEVPKVETPVAKKEPLIGKVEANTEASDRNILAGKLNHKPLQDLRSGIPLNEKFGIIRSLFKGNASDFGDAVLKLNNAASVDEMSHYLTLLGQRFGWDQESEAYRSFFVYVERKMMTLQPSNANTDK